MVPVSTALSLTNPEGVYEEEALRDTVGDTLPDLVSEGEVEAVRDTLPDLVTEGEVEVVRVEDGDWVVVPLMVTTPVTEGLPLTLACDAVPVKVYKADGDHPEDTLANPDRVAMVPDGMPLIEVLEDTLTLPEALGHTDGDTDKEYVGEEVGVTSPDKDSTGERVVEEVVDRVPQAVAETVRVPDPHTLALAVEVTKELPDLLPLGDIEVEKEPVGVTVPVLDLEIKALGERLEEEVWVPLKLPDELVEGDTE